MRRRKESTVGKKPANSSQKPYASTAMPTIAQPHTTSARPPRKKAEPCARGRAALLGAPPHRTMELGPASRAGAALEEAAAGAQQIEQQDKRWQTDPVRTLSLQLSMHCQVICTCSVLQNREGSWSARAFRFFLLMKKRRVACGPIVSDTPARNMSCPAHRASAVLTTLCG